MKAPGTHIKHFSSASNAGKVNGKGSALRAVPVLQKKEAKNASNPIQLVVDIHNSADVWGDLMTERNNAPLSKTEMKIFNNWDRSATLHRFRTAQKLDEALAAAVATRATEPNTRNIASRGLPDPPALFRAANLQFLTSTGGPRLETLYFNDGVNSARIRQQHPSGPLVQEARQGKIDYFGARAVLDQIKNEARTEAGKDLHLRNFESVQTIIHRSYAGNEAFALGQNHMEIWYTGQGHPDNYHTSEGTTVANPGYTDPQIKTIYSKVVGRIS